LVSSKEVPEGDVSIRLSAGPHCTRHLARKHHAEAAPYRSLAHSIGVVGKAEPRTEVVGVVVIDVAQGANRPNVEVSIHTERARIVYTCGWVFDCTVDLQRIVEVVSEPQIKGQLWRDLPIVLHKKTEFAQVAIKHTLPKRSLRLARFVIQQIVQARVVDVRDLWVGSPAVCVLIVATKLE